MIFDGKYWQQIVCKTSFEYMHSFGTCRTQCWTYRGSANSNVVARKQASERALSLFTEKWQLKVDVLCKGLLQAMRGPQPPTENQEVHHRKILSWFHDQQQWSRVTFAGEHSRNSVSGYQQVDKTGTRSRQQNVQEHDVFAEELWMVWDGIMCITRTAIIISGTFDEGPVTFGR